MTVPTSMSGLNTAAANNSPAGTDIVGPTMDDFMRAAYSILRRESAKGADIASATTIDFTDDGNYFTVTGDTTINGFSAEWIGRMIHIIFSGAPLLTHNATSFILPGGANIQAAAGDVASFVEESAGNWRCLSFVPSALTRYRLIDVQTFTANGTWTKPAGTIAAYTRGLGGGGAGGGAGATSGTQNSFGGGGASGAPVEEFITSGLGVTETVTVGAGGTGVSGAAGNSGGASSFGAHWSTGTAGGGQTATFAVSASITAAPGSVAASTGGGLNGSGAEGTLAIAVSNATTQLFNLSGGGGNSPWGAGGRARGGSNAGDDAKGLGAGGGGAINQESQSARAGGDGTPGFVTVHSYGL